MINRRSRRSRRVPRHQAPESYRRAGINERDVTHCSAAASDSGLDLGSSGALAYKARCLPVGQTPTTANSRCGSSIPLSSCRPRSSNRSPLDPRVSDRTVSDTNTSPGAEAPHTRDARFTAQP